MRNELALLRNMWPAVFLGTALVADQEPPERVPLEPSATVPRDTREDALEEAVLGLGSPLHFVRTR